MEMMMIYNLERSLEFELIGFHLRYQMEKCVFLKPSIINFHKMCSHLKFCIGGGI